MKVLVTGAGGFLGNAVLRRAPKGITDIRAHLGPPGFAPLEGNGTRGTTFHADVLDLDAFLPFSQGVDVVIHLAGPAEVAASFEHGAEYIRAHVLGTEAAVRLCLARRVARIVYVSSAEVYGRPTASPVPEDAPMSPRSPYGAAKVGAECVVAAGARAYGFQAVILRPFLVYGPAMRRGSVLAAIVEQAIAGSDVQLFDPRPVRDFCYVDDVADAVWRACETPPHPEPRVFNVGSGEGTSIADLARQVIAILGGAARIRHRPGEDRPRAADIVELVADVAAAHRDLGWKASTSLPDGLRKTVERWRTGASG